MWAPSQGTAATASGTTFEIQLSVRRASIKCFKFISPTHKRTEGRAPCGALSLLQKDAALQGGIQQNPL